mgnify:CR=1 FL=1
MTTQHPDTPETGITPGGTSGAFRDVLSKDHARRGKPPLHFVDMTPEQRVEKAAELGLPKFRVKQLANHYFGHFDVNAAEFTDFPAAKRSEAAAAFFPQLITEVTRQVRTKAPPSRPCGSCSTAPSSNRCLCDTRPAPRCASPRRSAAAWAARSAPPASLA